MNVQYVTQTPPTVRVAAMPPPYAIYRPAYGEIVMPAQNRAYPVLQAPPVWVGASSFYNY
jgi:hypothetical protein